MPFYIFSPSYVLDAVRIICWEQDTKRECFTLKTRNLTTSACSSAEKKTKNKNLGDCFSNMQVIRNSRHVLCASVSWQAASVKPTAKESGSNPHRCPS